MSWEQRNADFSKAQTDAQMAYIEAERELDRLQAENAELRELVRGLWQFTGAACKKYPKLFDPPAQGGQIALPDAIETFEQLLRELGIEVSDG